MTTMRPGCVVFIALQTEARANGGLESLTHIIRGIPGRKVVITQRETRFTALWRQAGCEVHVVAMPESVPAPGGSRVQRRVRRILATVAANRTVADIVRRTGATVAHCNDAGALLCGGIGARAAGARLVLNIRDTRVGGDYDVRWRIRRQLVDRIVVLSAEMKRELESALPPAIPALRAAPIRVIYSAIDLERMRPVATMGRAAIRSRLGIAESAYHVVYVGTFNDKKNQLEFIQRAAGLLLADPRVDVTFVGDFNPRSDPYSARCEGAARQLGIAERLRFAGFSETPEEWYQAADVVCLASRNEGLARAMIEALACGTPVVSFDVASAREILEGNGCGMVVPQGDYDGLVTALLRLRDDPAQRVDLGISGARVARTLFEPRRSVARYAELYGELNGA